MEEMQEIRRELSLPSRESWDRIMQFVMTIPDDRERELALLYVREHLREWPREACQITAWQSEEYWPLAREVVLEGESEEALSTCLERVQEHPFICSLVLRGFPQLESLAFVEELPGLEHLQILSSYHHPEGGDPKRADGVFDLAGLSFARELQTFTMVRECCVLDSLQDLSGCQALSSLSLEAEMIRGTLSPLVDCHQLQTLSLLGLAFHLDVSCLSGLPYLEHLTLGWYDPGYEVEPHEQIRSIRELALPVGLKTLDLTHFGFLLSLEGLLDLGSLESLALPVLDAASMGLHHIGGLELLTHLKLTVSDLSGLQALVIPKRLEVLEVFFRNISLHELGDLTFGHLEKVGCVRFYVDYWSDELSELPAYIEWSIGGS